MNVLLVAGSRTLYPTFHELDNASYIFDTKINKIISGGAKGVDSVAEQWAKTKGYRFQKFLAEWDTYGKKAGYIRNKEMVEECTHAIVVWDGLSKGTKMTIDLLGENKKPFILIQNAISTSDSYRAMARNR